MRVYEYVGVLFLFLKLCFVECGQRVYECMFFFLFFCFRRMLYDRVAVIYSGNYVCVCVYVYVCLNAFL